MASEEAGPLEGGPQWVDPFLSRTLPAEIQSLGELALDLRWTWSHGTDHIWSRLDPSAWEFTANPWLILQTVSQDRLIELSRDGAFLKELSQAQRERAEYLTDPGWYGCKYPNRHLSVAYFSMEFGLGEALMIYAGGLGILAGDFLKAASDLGVPVVAVGLLYQEGYFRQVLDEEGRQLEAYPYNDPATMPIVPVRDRSGGWMCVSVDLPGRSVVIRIWHARVGRVDFYLLDTNHPLNSPSDRGIASKLYDAEPERRLLQEIILGIGGWRALEALGIDPDILHMNEGHAAFAALERARSFALSQKISFEEACWATRAGNIFTTHTPVAAGFDRFEQTLVVKYFRDYAEDIKGTVGDLVAMGRPRFVDPNAPFNMAFLAASLSGRINAVSALHERVSKALGRPLFARWPDPDIPVTHVTNGVHTPSWDSEESDRLWTGLCGKGRWRGDLGGICDKISCASDEAIWEMRLRGRKAMVEYARAHLARDLGQRGADPEAIERARYVLDSNTLTLGLARRFAPYKRPTLILRDPERLRRLLLDPVRRVQLVVAGKAHPRDAEGKAMIEAFTRFSRDPEMRERLVFLEDYDMGLAQRMVEGVDVWINTPLRPWEACGTSGMKVLVNGGLNISTLDGWWAEAYRPALGWALGGGDGIEGDHSEAEAAQLYQILEREVVPLFYARDANGIPRQWVDRIRASMSTLTPRFSANRMVREYLENLYLPAADALRRRINEGARIARELNAWSYEIRRGWGRIHFGAARVERSDGANRFLVELFLGDVSPDLVRVQLYAETNGDCAREVIEMERYGRMQGAENAFIYAASVSASRPIGDYTARAIPFHPEAEVPLEDTHILWQR